jgi:F-type H+-transporting ATPase subunit b
MSKITRYGAVAITVLLCSTLWAEQAAESEGSGGSLFSGTLGDSLWTVAAFLVLATVLTKFAWKPLLAALEARQSHIEQQIRSAEDSRQKAEKMLEDYRQQGQTMVRQATEEAQRHRQQTLEQAREEVLALRRRAHDEVESAQAAAMEELWKQTGEIVLRVGSEVLGRTLTAQDNQHLIDEAVAQIKQSGGL